ncbi:MAG TPA: hypothetical protein VKQ72_08700 [Aggregatilineales bacterium]|nr:hypothetical protein [Aggregatilineales bacterium]
MVRFDLDLCWYERRSPQGNGLFWLLCQNRDGAQFTPYRQRKPTNPLGRQIWTLEATGPSKQRLPGTCATLTRGVHTLVRVLANNEALRATQASSDAVEPGDWPFDDQITEGLFAALYMLSEHAEKACLAVMDAVDIESRDQVD